MYRVLSCLITQHDMRLFILAAVVCAGATFTSFNIYRQVIASHGLQRFGWLLLTGVCMASGIWATHFIAMLAHDSGLPRTFGPVATIVSLISAAVLTTLGLSVSSRGGLWAAASGGLVLGGGIAVMHFTGMQALPGNLSWDMTMVAASLLIGTGLAATAMVTYHRRQAAGTTCMAAAIFALAVCGLHFSAMCAVTVVPDPTLASDRPELDYTLMAIAVAGVTCSVLLAGLAAALVNQQREVELSAQTLLFDAALNNMSQGLCMFDAEGRLLVCNERYAEIYNLPADQRQPGTSYRQILEQRVAANAYVGAPAAEVAQDLINTVIESRAAVKMVELGDGRTIIVRHQPLVAGAGCRRTRM